MCVCTVVRRALRPGGALMAAVSDLLGEGLEEEKKEVSLHTSTFQYEQSDTLQTEETLFKPDEDSGGHLGEGPAEELAEVTPLPPSPSPPPPLMVPAADITADIMALMEDRSPPPSAPIIPPPPPPPPRSPFCSFSPPLASSSITPLIAAS